MLHGFVQLREIVVAARLVRVHRGVRHHVLFQIALQLVFLGVVDRLRLDLSRGAIQDAYHRPFAFNASFPITLGGMPIPCLATEVGLVDLDRSEHQAVLPIGKGRTNAVT